MKRIEYKKAYLVTWLKSLKVGNYRQGKDRLFLDSLDS